MAKKSPAEISENGRVVLERRYLMKGPGGTPVETPDELFRRVAKSVASVEASGKGRWAERFEELMRELRFLPNSPTLMNAGRPNGQLSACFVLPVEDSLEGIFESLKQAARIHQSGGGTGFAFSRLRPRGSPVKSTRGIASGPVSFIRIFDMATETVKQGGARRGANMAVLRVDHPDIVDFVDSKRDQKSILNFNISVGSTREFMDAVRVGGEFWLRDPASGEPIRKMAARGLFDRIVLAAWECGDPGMVFLDRINLLNPTPRVGPMESTNPCGEQPLLPYESCNLGSLNLSAYVRGRKFDWDSYRADIATAVRFLDDVIELNAFPVEASRKITLANRKIGLGVMGFADLLLQLGIPYSSGEAFAFGETLMSFLDREAKQVSAELARKRGAFPNWRGCLWDRLGFPKLRNATVTTVAPTGTISVIAGVSSGIEPIFSGVFYRNVLDGSRLMEVHPIVGRLLRERGSSVGRFSDARLRELLGSAWTPAQDVPVEAHVRMQAAFQRHSDSAVSKTINLPNDAKPSDVSRAYLLAYELGCKGITVYRDGSRSAQVLDRWETEEQAVEGCPSC